MDTSTIPPQVTEWWDWLLSQLGWSGQLNFVQVILLVLAGLAVILLLRFVLGRGGSGGGIYNGPINRSIDGGQRRQPNYRMHIADPRISDFSINRKYYNMNMPSPEIKTDGLKGPVPLNIDKAQEMFVPKVSETKEKPVYKGPSWNKARELFVGGQPKQEESQPEIVQPETPPVEEQKVRATTESLKTTEPDWKLARRLFIPPFKR